MATHSYLPLQADVGHRVTAGGRDLPVFDFTLCASPSPGQGCRQGQASPHILKRVYSVVPRQPVRSTRFIRQAQRCKGVMIALEVQCVDHANPALICYTPVCSLDSVHHRDAARHATQATADIVRFARAHNKGMWASLYLVILEPPKPLIVQTVGTNNGTALS